jgi:hypothetical protein
MQIALGAMCSSIAEQLAEQGLEQTGRSVELLDRLAKAITLAHLHGCLTDGESTRARQRLIKMVKARKIEAANAAPETTANR